MNKSIIMKCLVIVITFFFIEFNFLSNIMSGALEQKNLNNDIVTNNLLYISNSTSRFYPMADTAIIQHFPHANKNFGDSFHLMVSNRYGYTPDFEADLLIRFDLSSITSNTIIIMAKLHLFYFDYKGSSPTGRYISCYRITSDWYEYIATFNQQPNHNSIETSSAIVPPSKNNWMEWDITNDVQDFIKGSKTNYGWWIYDDNHWGSNNYMPKLMFYSKETSFAPYLEIVFAGNQPPNIPSNPYPSNHKSFVNINTTLRWTCSDSNSDNITYDVYFEEKDNTPDILVSYDQSATSYNPRTLEYNKTYYWKITAKDIFNASTDGPIWDFSTNFGEYTPPDTPQLTGTTRGKIGDINKYHATTTDPDPDDKIDYYWDFDDGTHGFQCLYLASGEICEVTHIWKKPGIYNVTVYATDNHGARSSIKSLTITMSKKFIIPQIYEWLFHQSRFILYQMNL